MVAEFLALEDRMLASGLLELTVLHAVGRASLLLAEEFTRTIKIQLIDVDS